MFNLLFLIPALPFAGFLVLALLGRMLSKKVIALVGVATWIGAHEFVNSKLIPRLCGLSEQDRLMEG